MSSPRAFGTASRAAAATTLVAALACVVPGRARADALVTLCQSDTQIGNGRNLEEALQDPSPPANNGAYRTVTFACPGGAATIRMTRQHPITHSMIIDGGGTITLDGGGTSDMFTANDPSLRLFLSNLVLRNAKVPPPRCGPIICLGSVVSGVLDLEIVNHTRIENSPAAIDVLGGSLHIADSVFAGNAEGAVVATAPVNIERSTFQDSNGVPLVATNAVRISDSTFSNNRRMGLPRCGQVTVERTSFLNNTADGALLVGCNAAITGSTFLGNSTTGDGGAVTVTGGAQTVTVRTTRFLNNSANGDGGALHVADSLTNDQTTLVLRHDTFDGNKARTGGAIDYQTSTDKVLSVDAAAVVLSHNMSAADGGAIALRGGDLQLLDSFVTDNTANGSGGAVAVSGAECIPLGSVKNCNRHLFANVLFVRNKAAVAGGAFSGTYATFVNSTVDSNSGPALAFSAMSANAFSVVRLVNTLVSHSSGAGCGPADRAAQYIDGGHNLQFPGKDCGSSIPSKDPQLDSMYIPIPLSPPTSAGDLATCTAFPVSMHDVYSGIRPQGKSCTIGAAEGNIRDQETEKFNFSSDLWKRLKAALPPGTH